MSGARSFEAVNFCLRVIYSGPARQTPGADLGFQVAITLTSGTRVLRPLMSVVAWEGVSGFCILMTGCRTQTGPVLGLGNLSEAFRTKSSAEGFRMGQVAASASGTTRTRQVWRVTRRGACHELCGGVGLGRWCARHANRVEAGAVRGVGLA